MENLNTVMWDRITRALELLALQAPRPRVKIAPPTFDSNGDVELFIRDCSTTIKELSTR